MEALTAIGMLSGLSLVLASLLALAQHFLRVEEDPRVDAVHEMLPHANCGACGQPGCRPFAEALVAGRVQSAACTVGSAADRERIADYLGVDVGVAVRRVARLACAGGTHVARNRAHYTGPKRCGAAAVVAGGDKACSWGCIGHGDCAVVCDFDAIRMNEHALPVVDEERCTACGDCVVACPKDLFSLEEVDVRLWVACRSRAEGDGQLDDCEVACTACGRCAMDAPEGLVTMSGPLPVVDARRATPTRAPTLRCPTGAIVWIDPAGKALKGPAARPVLRKSARRDAPT